MSPTITESYRRLQQELHQNPHYGVASLAFSPIVAKLISEAGVKTISDYGAGKQNLLRGLKNLGHHPQEYHPYDPAFPEYGPPPELPIWCAVSMCSNMSSLNVSLPFLMTLLR